MLSYLKTSLCKGILLAGLVMLMTVPGLSSAAVNIAAASDLKFVLEALAADYHASTGRRVNLSFGSSGVFATQIAHGAPFQLFLSADEHYVLELHKQGLTQDQGALYALGRIALIAPKASRLQVDVELAGLRSLMEAGTLRRFAIANPHHAPYGKRAMEALQHAGLWQKLQPYLVYGENVSQAVQFAVSGSAQGGIVALSLAVSPQLASQIDYVVLPEDWHAPLKQRMVLLRNAGEEARNFYRYLQMPAARKIFRQYGFTLPNENA